MSTTPAFVVRIDGATFAFSEAGLTVDASGKVTKLRVPENWDHIKDLSGDGYACYAGANDWENSWTACSFNFSRYGQKAKRVWGHIADHEDEDHGKDIVQTWVAAADALRHSESLSGGRPVIEHSMRPEHFTRVAPHIAGLIGYGVEATEWHAASAAGSDPINDNDSGVSKNPAPPAAQPIKNAPPNGADTNSEPAPKPKVPDTTSTTDDTNPEYVGGKVYKSVKDDPRVDPAHLPNPETGGLNPNPDNPTNIPVGGQTPDSFDDDSAKPNVDSQPWFMGKKLRAAIDPFTGLAKWPLSFEEVEDDFKRPNKEGPHDYDRHDSIKDDATKLGEEEKPYVAVLPKATRKPVPKEGYPHV